MKLMKHITIALVLCAIPAMAFGQTAACDDCNHQVSVYHGSGGLVAMADDADMVNYRATCGNITRTGELMANDDGMVSMLFSGDMACMADDASFELGPIMDGGWFWINAGDNSAVGNLVAKDVLDNMPVKIADAGDSVTLMAGKGAVLLTHTSGRVGILPTILPEPPMDPAAVCGPRASRSFPYAYTGQATSSCMLGGGRTKIRLVGPGSFGSTAMITNGMVYRPNAGTVTVTADLWVDESGSYSTATDNNEGTGPTATSIQKGWIGKTATASGSGSGENWLTATFDLSVAAAVGGPTPVPTDGSAAVAGVTLTNTGSASTNPDRSPPPPAGQAVFTIGPNGSYCSRTANHTAVINIYATPGVNAIHPAVARGRAAGLGSSSALGRYAAITQLRVVCPPSSSSANMGQELVPDNPFPTDR